MALSYLAKLVLKLGVVLIVVTFIAFSFSDNQILQPQWVPQPRFDLQPPHSEHEQLLGGKVIKTQDQSADIQLGDNYETSGSDTGRYENLASGSDESGTADNDQIKNDKYHLRFWDLVNSAKASDHVPSTIPLFNDNKLDYLWRRPMGGQREIRADSDSILQQMVWQMEAPHSSYAKSLTPKTIVIWDGLLWWEENDWNDPKQWKSTDCGIAPNIMTQCIFTEKLDDLNAVDAVVAVRDSFHSGNVVVPEHVLKFYFMLESPFHSSGKLERSKDLLATYWRGSDVVTPYAKWTYYDLNTKLIKHDKNYAQGKSKTVAAFVSNCRSHNDRMGYIDELKKYIQIDVYGACGKFQCFRSNAKDCFEMLKKDYYFYMSFENSNCRDYVTEKLFTNGLSNDIVPIVMGAHPEDYQALAPYKSYIHVEEFNSPKELGEYLEFLIKNPSNYNEYFEWKGTGEFIPSTFFCQICAMVHYADIVPPPERIEPYVWGREQAIDSQMCLPRGQWYWTKYNNGTSKTKDKH